MRKYTCRIQMSIYILHIIHFHTLSWLPCLLEILFLPDCYLQGRRQLPSIRNSYSRNFTSWPVTRLWSKSRLDGSFHSIQFYGNPQYWPWHAYKSNPLVFVYSHESFNHCFYFRHYTVCSHRFSNCSSMLMTWNKLTAICRSCHLRNASVCQWPGPLPL